MFSRTWVTRDSPVTGNSFCESPASGVRGRSVAHATAPPPRRLKAASSFPLRAAASSEQASGWLPRKWRVSTVTARNTPGTPSRTMHQSEPGVRRRRVSQPSIHLPRLVYLPSRNTGGPGFSRLDLGAKNSSLASTARPPTRAAARSINPARTNTSQAGATDPPPRILCRHPRDERYGGEVLQWSRAAQRETTQERRSPERVRPAALEGAAPHLGPDVYRAARRQGSALPRSPASRRRAAHRTGPPRLRRVVTSPAPPGVATSRPVERESGPHRTRRSPAGTFAAPCHGAPAPRRA